MFDALMRQLSTPLLLQTPVEKADAFQIVLYSLAVSVILAAIHIASPHILGAITAFHGNFISFGGGMAASYVFLELLPELETVDRLVGRGIHGVVLLGFLITFSLERWALRRLHADENDGAAFGVRLSTKCLYFGLLVFTMQEAMNHDPVALLLYTSALGLHVIQVDHHLAKEHPDAFHSIGRHLLAASLLVGWGFAVWHEGDVVPVDILIAFLAGGVLFEVFHKEVPHHESSHLGWFIGGAALYAILWRGHTLL